jgi:sterol desaturase/sphingolipid hydroxylase (fatty acid hydroxylase superfamily)
MYNLSFIPFLAYWIACGLCSLFRDNFHQSSNKNTVESATVFKNVFLLTASTVPANCLVFYFNIISKDIFRWYYILIGIWWVDTIEYFTHYIMHKVPFLYKNFHKEHHKLHNTYSYGALYNSNFEATLTSSMMLYGFYLLGISFPEFICVTTLANIATVLDHSEELTFFNYKRRFHDLHHSKYQNANFQQPFFTYYDKIFGTYKE